LSVPNPPVGLLGGTFDPIHFGHLRMAEELAEVFSLDRVLFMPSGIPPHRAHPLASPAQRLAMTRLAVSGNPRFLVSDLETRKASPSYMVDTLSSLRRDMAAPAAPLLFFMGLDAFAGLTSWHRWRELFDLAHLVVAHRPGQTLGDWEAALPQALAIELAQRRCPDAGELMSAPAGRIRIQPMTQLDISATDLRARLAEGRSVRYLMPDAVIDFITEQQLYPPQTP